MGISAENTVLFPGPTALDGDPARALEIARQMDLTEVVVIGWERHPDGAEHPVFVSSIADGADVCRLMRHWEQKLRELNLHMTG